MRLAPTGCPFLFLLRLLSEFVISLCSSEKLPFSVSFKPPYVHDLVTGESATVEMTLNVEDPLQFELLSKSIVLKSMDIEIASVVSAEQKWLYNKQSPLSNTSTQYKTHFTVYGKFLGKTKVCVQLATADDMLDPNDSFYKEINFKCRQSDDSVFDVWVKQQTGRAVNHMFLSALVLLIIIANVLMGCELDLNLVMETLKKPIPPLIGFCSQFVAMPLLAYAIAVIVFTSKGLDSFALGLFVTGCAPGGGASNYWTLLLDGDVPVSITMTFISTLASLVMMPAWMLLLESRLLQNDNSEFHIKIPYTKILSSLLIMVIPLFIGIALVRWKPAVQSKARKIMRPFLIFVVSFLIGFGALANWYIFRLLTWTALLGGLLLPWCGFTVGCFASLLTNQSPKVVTAIAIETGIQNTGIAIMLLKFSFSEPDSDVSAVMPIITACFTPFPLLFMVGVHKIIKYVKQRRQESLSDAEVVKKLNYVDYKIPPVELDGKEKEKEISV